MKKIITLLVLLAAAAAAFIWWRKPTADVDGDNDAKPVAQVQVIPLQKQSISQTLSTIGLVEPAAAGSISVSVGYDSIVKSLQAPVGARVVAGDAIMEIEPTPDAKLQIDSARGAAVLAEESLAATKQRFELKLATSDDLRAAEQTAQDAKLKLESFTQRGMGDTSKILAPVAGVIVKLDSQPGAVVAAGTSLVTLASSALFEAKLSVEITDAAALKVGQKVTLYAVIRGDAAPVVATVGAVDATVDAASGSTTVRVPLAANGLWFAGEHVRGEIETDSRETLVVPRAAVLPDDDQNVLYTVKDHKAVKHSVQLGLLSADKVEVAAKDLAVGDSVVVLGNYELSDGMDVQLPGESDKETGDKDEAKPNAKPAAKADSEKSEGK